MSSQSALLGHGGPGDAPGTDQELLQGGGRGTGADWKARGIILVYDVTRRSTFECLAKWIKQMEESITNDYKVVLLGNKIDLAEQRSVSTLEGKELAKKKGYQFFETSAKTNEDKCVDKAIKAFLETATEEMIKKEKEDLRLMIANQKKKITKLNPEVLDKTSCC